MPKPTPGLPPHPHAKTKIPEEGIGFGEQYKKVTPLAESAARRQERIRKGEERQKQYEEQGKRYAERVAKVTRMRQVIDDYTRRHKTPTLTKDEYDELYTGGRKRRTRRRRLTKKRRM